MSNREKIYNYLPTFIQDGAISLESYRIKKRRYSPSFYKYLSAAEERSRLNKSEIESYVLARLKENLIIAYNQSSYYKDLLNQFNINPYTFSDIDNLKILPIQNKRTIIENFDQILNRDYKGKYFQSHTSGTTGAGFIFPQTIESEHQQWSVWWRYRKNIGIDLNSWCMIFGGRSIISPERNKPPYWKWLPGLKQVSFSMYHLNQDTVKHYVDKINCLNIGWIHGYPSTISYLSSLILEQGLKINNPIKFVTTGAENLLDYQKKIIHEVFKVLPFQHYGLAEPVANISECEFRKLHVDEDFSFVELVPEEDNPKHLRIIGTSFTNEVLQFIRYDTKDIVTLADNQQCMCGRMGRIIESIDGRSEDFITMKNGTKIGRLDHILKDMINIKEAQIRQDKEGHVSFFIVKTDQFEYQDEVLLKNEIESRLILDNYDITYVNHIPKTSSGKHKFVISEYSPS